ncbi:Pentatricopeptide repeat [Macleaya cordata]|uniref:Pentatricopeptide repeat n=1 Tax=Macleaya cordata TaxID=56857 RepID=A0A200QZ36_MACCD|nr:Pentatricopeptide repeat [Macleaya cordata]
MIALQQPFLISNSTSSPFSSLSSSPLSLLYQCKTIREIQQLHASTIKTGLFNQHPFSLTRILESCCTSFQSSSHSPPKSISINDVNYALSLFDHLTTLNSSSSSFLYNSLIRTLTLVDQPERAFLLFYYMLHENSNNPNQIHLPNKFTFPSVLKSCAQLSAIEEGEQVHGFILKTHFISDLYVQNSLIHMYAKCGKTESACKVFEEIPFKNKNVVSWNSMIDAFVTSGDIDSARKVFDEMPYRNVVSWNSMIAGYARQLLPQEAFQLFLELQEVSGEKPDESTLVSIISLISDLGLLSLGKRVHGYVIRREFSMCGGLGVALIDMYSKCGNINNALQVFKDIQNKNVGHWTSMIIGFAVHGFAEDSLHLFSEMQRSGVKPNSVTFIGVLSACRHGGLIEEGLKLFKLMRGTYKIEPTIQHYGCLVDLLGRSGFLKEAKTVIDNMGMGPGPVIWGTLLAACRNHGDIEIGEIAAKRLVELTPDYGGGYVLLSNLYARSGRWEDFGRTRRVIGNRGLAKVSGLSWIEVDGEIHEFLVGDNFHPRSGEIYRLLDGLERNLRWTEL